MISQVLPKSVSKSAALLLLLWLIGGSPPVRARKKVMTIDSCHHGYDSLHKMVLHSNVVLDVRNSPSMNKLIVKSVLYGSFPFEQIQYPKPKNPGLLQALSNCFQQVTEQSRFIVFLAERGESIYTMIGQPIRRRKGIVRKIKQLVSKPAGT